MKLKLIFLTFVLVIIGAINWGIVGLFGLDLVATLFGFSPVLVKTVYSLVGLSGIYLLFLTKGILNLMGNKLLN